jgi:hypothetical protein
MDKEMFENSPDPDHSAGAGGAEHHGVDPGPSYPGILDEDPALDFILLNEMEKEVSKGSPRQKGSCSGIILLFLVPAGFTVWIVLHLLI